MRALALTGVDQAYAHGIDQLIWFKSISLEMLMSSSASVNGMQATRIECTL